MLPRRLRRHSSSDRDEMLRFTGRTLRDPVIPRPTHAQQHNQLQYIVGLPVLVVVVHDDDDDDAWRYDFWRPMH